MLKLSGWHIMLAIIAAGIGVGVYFEPVNVIPLMIWAFLAAAVAAGIEMLIGRKGCRSALPDLERFCGRAGQK